MTAAGVPCPQQTGGQYGLISRSKALGSHPLAGSVFLTPHPSRLDSPYPLAPGHAWVCLHFGPSLSVGTYQGPSLLLVANSSHPRPSSSHKTHTPHTPHATTQHPAPRPGCPCPPEGTLRCWGRSEILGACQVVDGQARASGKRGSVRPAPLPGESQQTGP